MNKKPEDKKPELTSDELIKKYQELVVAHNKVLEIIEKASLDLVVFCRKNQINIQ